MRTSVAFSAARPLEVRTCEFMGIQEVYIDEMTMDGDHQRATFYVEHIPTLEETVRKLKAILAGQKAVVVEKTDHVEAPAVAGEERWDRDAT